MCVCVGNQSTINGIEIECHPCLDLCIVCLWVRTPGIVHRRKINARILEEKGKRRRDKRSSPPPYVLHDWSTTSTYSVLTMGLAGYHQLGL